MVGNFKVVYLTSNAKTVGERTYYNCSVMQGTDVKTLSCDKDVCDKMKGREMSEVNLCVEIGEFNDKEKGLLKTYRAVDVAPLK